MSQNQICRNGKIAISANDEIGIFAGGFDINIVHGAHGFEVLKGNGFGRASAFINIAVDATNQANI